MEKFVIRRSSWHGKLYEKFYGWHYNPPSNFCSYFWSIFFALIFSGGVVFACLTLITGIIVFPLDLFGISLPISEGVLEILTAVGLLTYIGAIFFLLVEVIKYFRMRTAKSTSSAKEPGLLYTKYRSFKDKVCPLVEMKDG